VRCSNGLDRCGPHRSRHGEGVQFGGECEQNARAHQGDDAPVGPQKTSDHRGERSTRVFSHAHPTHRACAAALVEVRDLSHQCAPGRAKGRLSQIVGRFRERDAGERRNDHIENGGERVGDPSDRQSESQPNTGPETTIAQVETA